MNENWEDPKFEMDKNWQTKNGEIMRFIQKFREAGQAPVSVLTMVVNACHGAGSYRNLAQEAGLW